MMMRGSGELKHAKSVIPDFSQMGRSEGQI